jgi:lactate dehydrogenase-like 2-hydroxyacid dehydrogenase
MQDPHLVELGVEYVSMDELMSQSQIISLNCPLLESTHHLINDATIARMRDGVMIVNTGRGKLIDSAALLRGLKTKKIGSVALDVYEEVRTVVLIGGGPRRSGSNLAHSHVTGHVSSPQQSCARSL